MAIIRLTKGYETIVDDDRFEELNSYNWYASGLEGRPARRLKAGPRKLILMYHQVLHVLPWVMSKMGYEVDHIDGNPLNNQLDNLRIVSHKENMQNSITSKTKQGTAYDSTHDRYKAYIDRHNMPRWNVGTYRTQAQADEALANAKRELGLEDN